MRLPIVVMLALLALIGNPLSAADWPAFRGPGGDGVSSESQVPLRWAPDQNIRWKSPLPSPGNGSPIVSSGRVFLTCATEAGKKRGLYCFDRRDGRQLWAKVVDYAPEDPTHGTNPYCGSSPAADGKRVVVWHGSAGLFCYDYDGKELWSRDLGIFKHIWGYGSSPVFHAGKIYLNCGPGERTFVTAIDSADGKTIWQTDEPGGASGEKGNTEWIGSWSTPQIVGVEGRDQVLVTLPYHLNAYDPSDGKILWTCDGLGKLVYTSPVFGEGVGVAMSGFHGPAMGFKLGGSGNVTASNRLWHESAKIPQRIGSGMIIGPHMYMANEQFIAQCFDVQTGKELWQTRMPEGALWASLVRVGDRLYVTNQKGTTIVFRPNPDKFELLAENALGEQTNSTLAISDGEIFLRTFQSLHCISEKQAQ
ncbi:MAG: PQQ-binding-like beta-propeller repeat protein [Planctomycetia bacterium]|nr:PQQ-binding-like beta-propeller repeat protein [Planctomycetia bacterium]